MIFRPVSAGVAHRAADHELAGRVHVDEALLADPALVVHLLRQDRTKNVVDQIRLDHRLRVDSLAVLGRDEHPLDLDRAPVALLVDLVADGDLGLPVGAQVREDVGLAHLGEALRELVRDHDRERHQLRRLVGGVAEHEALVAGADAVERIVVARLVLVLEGVVDALRDIRRLLVERDDHAAGLGVEAVLRARVADRGDPFAHEPRDVDVGLRRDLTCDDHEPGRDERLARDAPRRVGGQHGIQDGVRDLVGNLVGVPLGD